MMRFVFVSFSHVAKMRSTFYHVSQIRVTFVALFKSLLPIAPPAPALPRIV